MGVGGLILGGSVSAGVGALVLAGYLSRYRWSPGVAWFIGSLIAVSVWCLAYGSGLLVFVPSSRIWFTVVWLLGGIWSGPLFLLFAMAYTGRTAIARSWQAVVLLAVPVSGSILLSTAPYHSLLWTEFQLSPVFGLATASYTLQPIAYLIITYALLCAGTGVLVLVETVISYGPLYRGEAIAIALSVVPPIVGVFPWLFNFGPTPQLSLAPPLFLAHLAFDSYAFVGGNMFQTNPTTRRAAERSVIDDIGSPVFVLDPADRIVRVNDAAIAVFDIDDTAILGTPISELVAVDGEKRTVTITTDSRDRQFNIVTATLTDPADTAVGRTVILQDITKEREREQRLDVLNRVIRHNLRNELTVMLGHARIVQRQADDEQIEASSETITNSAQRLLATGDKARKFEQLKQGQTDTKPVDVTTLVHDTVAEFEAEFPDAAVTIDVAESVDTTTDTVPPVLSLVVVSLLENALTHTETDDPQVAITLDHAADGGLTITISDNGPGIDPDELAPIRKGHETSLEHSTGIGLWVVSWGVSMLGGEIEFTTTEDGTDVTVRLN